MTRAVILAAMILASGAGSADAGCFLIGILGCPRVHHHHRHHHPPNHRHKAKIMMRHHWPANHPRRAAPTVPADTTPIQPVN
jgi:hypothetical protein